MESGSAGDSSDSYSPKSKRRKIFMRKQYEPYPDPEIRKNLYENINLFVKKMNKNNHKSFFIL